jgi:hypothetical protein
MMKKKACVPMMKKKFAVLSLKSESLQLDRRASGVF